MLKWVTCILCIFCAHVALASAEIKVLPISNRSKTFLGNEYKIINKRIILYDPSIKTDSCAHTQAFYKYLMATKNNPNIQKYFVTKPFPSAPKNPIKFLKKEDKLISRYDNFVTECGPVCIVNLQNNWIYQFPPDHINATGAIELLRTINELYNK